MIARVAGEFVLVRQTTMRGVDLDRFDFDFDLTWMGFFLDGHGRTLGRYGGRDAASAEGRSSLAGLRRAMERALLLHRSGKAPAVVARKGPMRTVDDYPASRRMPARSCVHCHHVYDFRREALEDAGRWTTAEVWVYPLPENLGLVPDLDRAEVLKRVLPGSAAARAGLLAGDELVRVGGRVVASFGDLQYALHRAPTKGTLKVRYRRAGNEQTAEVALADGWRKTDVSWRWSLRGVGPSPGVQGADLSVKEKKALGLGPTRLALEQGAFVSQQARQAGVRQGDVIVGVGGKMLSLTARQFLAHVRLNHRDGDRVTYNLLRDGKRVDVTLTLRARPR